MKKVTQMMIALSLLSAGAAQADPVAQDACKGTSCRRPHPECFNVYCAYPREGGRSDHFETACESAAKFTHDVWDNGHEVLSDSPSLERVEFEVKCDEHVLFNGQGRRFTNHAGTRIQAETGPFPAMLLPKGSLRDGHRYVESSLEFSDERLPGYCYVYTGAP